ncbi:MAG: CinA family protein [Parvibaculaceae bacterium]|nr:CinA family protein [Parvibaculaceae bacterium]
MESLLPLAEKAADLLKSRSEKIAIGESSVGGLVSAALIAQAGASAFFLGSTVIYTREVGRILRDRSTLKLEGLEPLTPEFAQAMADGFKIQMGSDWATSEMGAAGPAGSPYGPKPGTAVVAVSGPVSKARLVETGSADRIENMRLFGKAQLELLIECLDEVGT